jgi:hypothetical protein
MIRMYSYTQPKFVAGAPNQRQLRLEMQLADVFSWLLAIAEKLNLSSTEGSVHLSTIIWDRYGSDEEGLFRCWHCKEAV